VLPSVYIASDGTNDFFRFRVSADPTGGGGLASTAYVVDLAVNGTLVGAVGVNGKSPSSDYVYVADAAGVDTLVYANPLGFRVVPDGTGQFFVDFQVPLSSITAVMPQVTGSTPVQLFYGSSQAANLTVINKDFMTGSAVDFTQVATVILQEASLSLAKTSAVVSGPNPPAVGQTTTYDLTLAASNSGANPLAATVITDTIPSFATIVSTSSASGSISATGQLVTWQPANIGPGGTVTATIRVSIDPARSDAGSNLTLNPGASGTGHDALTQTSTSATSNQIVVGPVTGSPGGPPVGVNDSANTSEDQPVAIDVLSNDSDPDNDPLTVTRIISGPSDGSVQIGAGGSITYTPDPNFNGQDSFTYEVCDNQTPPLCDSATVSVAVSPVNDAPIAQPDAGTVSEDGSTNVAVLSNDSDVEGQTLTVTSVTQGTNGAVSINPNGTVSYVPGPDFAGTDSFTYTVCDNGSPSQCDTTTVTMTVTPVNDPPIARDDLASTFKGTAVSIPVLDNDSDIETPNGSLVITTAGGAIHGSASIQGAEILYTPDAGYIGSDSFTYTIQDEGGATSTATVNVTVADQSAAPVAQNDAISVDEDGTVTADLIGNDTDPNPGDTLTISNVTDGSNGLVTLNPDGTITYVPDADFNGNDLFTYTVCDDGTPIQCDSATVAVTVRPVNDPPVAVGDLSSTDRNSPVTIDVLANDSDIDGGALSISSATQGSGGSVVVVNGQLVYTPTLGFVGSDSFTYVVSDGNGGTDQATVNVTVNQTAQAPVASNDQATIGEDTSIDVNVLSNDSDPNGDPIVVTRVSDGTNGTTSINNDGSVRYQPAPDFFGTDSFTYEVCDNDTPQGCDTARVTVDVVAVNDAPTANPDLISAQEDTPVSIDVLANDDDPEGDSIYIDFVSGPSNGTVTFTANGPVIYTPAKDFNGNDSFTYRICDSGTPVQCSSTSVVVVVSALNDAPVATDDIAATVQSSSVVVPVLQNDSDPEGGALTVTGVTQPAGPNQGTVTLAQDGTVTYQAGTATGDITFDYSIVDPEGGTAVATVTVTVSDASGPVALADTGDVPEDGLVITYPLDNDSGQGLVLSSVTDGAHGTASIGVDGYSVTYVPAPDFNGSDVLTYSVCDQNGNCSTATITITVTPVNDPPTAGNDALTVDEDTPGVVTVLANDWDVDGDPLGVVSITGPSHGTAVVSPDGSVTYTPGPDFNGSDSFDYTVSDGQGGTAVGSVAISVNPVNDPPVAVDDTASSSGDPVTVDVLANDQSREPGSGLQITSVTNGTDGTVTIDPAGTVTYTPNPGFSGADVFSYTICQTPVALACDSANVTVNVAPAVTTTSPVTTSTIVVVDTTSPVTTLPPVPTEVPLLHHNTGGIGRRMPHRDPVVAATRPSSLPFTGAAVLSLVAIGLLLIGFGTVMARRRRRSSSSD
jgi:LPXTG-motif cell wall-anchored protein